MEALFPRLAVHTYGKLRKVRYNNYAFGRIVFLQFMIGSLITGLLVANKVLY